jgi:hypothetical protein
MEVQTGKIISAQKEPTHFMFASKILIILSIVVLYVMQMLIFIPILGVLLEQNLGEMNNDRLTLVGILLCIALVLDLASFILAIIGSVKQEEPLTKMSIIIKAIFIPFFLVNITLYIFAFLGMLSPFLMWAIPAVLCIGACLTYLYMFMTSWPDIIYMIIYTIKSKRRPKLFMVLGIIMEFFFVFDIVGAIFVNKAYKESLEEQA